MNLYADALDKAIGSAPKRGDRAPGAPNSLAAWFIGQMEPPVKTRFKAPGALQPSSQFEITAARAAFDAAIDRQQRLLADAWTIDLTRKRFANPLLFGLPIFNVASAFLITLAHVRRHVAQAQAVRAARDARR